MMELQCIAGLKINKLGLDEGKKPLHPTVNGEGDLRIKYLMKEVIS